MYALAFWMENRTRPRRARRRVQSIAGGAVVERAVRARLTAASDGEALGPARLLITKSGVQLELGRR